MRDISKNDSKDIFLHFLRGGDFLSKILLYLHRRFWEFREMLDQSTFDFILMLLIFGVIAMAFALIAHALKRRRRNRMCDPVDHRKWNHHKHKHKSKDSSN